MRAMSRYWSTSSFLAEEATAIRIPALRTRRSRSGTAEDGRSQRQILGLEAIAAPLFKFLAVVLVRQRTGRRE